MLPEEHLWISIDLCGSDCLLIGGIYRSPSSNICDSTKSLCDLLQSVVGHSSHLLICGDFNYSDINWSDPLDPIPNTAHSQLFIDTFQDLFLYQHVDEPTRYSLSATPHTLDLVFTNEENMVTNLYYLPGLGNSDHSSHHYNFNRTDFLGMRNWLSSFDWAADFDSTDVPSSQCIKKSH